MHHDFEYVDSSAKLEHAMEVCRGHEAVSVDTEFMRSHTYYPEVGLVQIFDGEHCFLIDPLVIGSMAPLAALLRDPDVIKVFHACSEDLEVFQYATGVVPSPLFDTQIAAAVLGTAFSMSYQNLVERWMGHVLPKDETRSDWLARPLSEAQLKYAALDVIYLLEVYGKQRQELIAAAKLSWVEDECKGLLGEIATNIDPDLFYQRIRSAGRMAPYELNVLRPLCAWREKQARTMNIPRNRVIDEKSLVAITKSQVRTRAGLQEVGGLTPRQVRKFGDQMLDIIEEANEASDDTHPPMLEDASQGNVRNEQIKMLKRVVSERADVLNIAPEILAKRRQLEQLLRSGSDNGEYSLPESLGGWREQAIGTHLLAALKQG